MIPNLTLPSDYEFMVEINPLKYAAGGGSLLCMICPYCVFAPHKNIYDIMTMTKYIQFSQIYKEVIHWYHHHDDTQKRKQYYS